uniref:Uncharacterized protein n=1 Tax=Rhizophora mucronata TaxID=61149 RepID=A0A2P2QWD3_RHIMU
MGIDGFYETLEIFILKSEAKLNLLYFG